MRLSAPPVWQVVKASNGTYLVCPNGLPPESVHTDRATAEDRATGLNAMSPGERRAALAEAQAIARRNGRAL